MKPFSNLALTRSIIFARRYFKIHLFVNFCLCLLLAGALSFASVAAAQDNQASAGQTNPTNQTGTDIAATPSSPIVIDEKVLREDPDVAKAYSQYRQSELEFLKAARDALDKSSPDTSDQVKSAEVPATKVSNPAETEKKSMIPKSPEEFRERARAAANQMKEWVTSASFIGQVVAIALAILLAPMIARLIRTRVRIFREPPEVGSRYYALKQYVYQAGDFLRPIVLIVLLGLFGYILKSIPSMGQDWLVKIAQGLTVVFLLYKVITTFVKNPLVRRTALWIVIPVALLAVFGYYDDLVDLLNSTVIIPMGDTPITAMTLVRLAIFGALFFWLGKLSNAKGQSAIRSQEGLDLATREVIAKMFQIVLFMTVAVLVLSFAGIPLSGLVMIFSAVGLGIGLGLQPIAANFVSGLIILFDRSVRTGDFVVLPDGQEGHVEAINMRNTIVETTDGKDIMVPNTVFTEGVYENWTHKDPRQRYEVHFTVSYDTDIDQLEGILIPEIVNYEKVLMEPEEPDLELREFGESGIHFAIEFWVSGIDDGENKFTSDLNYIVWRTLKAHNISMPLPQREIRVLDTQSPMGTSAPLTSSSSASTSRTKAQRAKTS